MKMRESSDQQDHEWPRLKARVAAGESRQLIGREEAVVDADVFPLRRGTAAPYRDQVSGAALAPRTNLPCVVQVHCALCVCESGWQDKAGQSRTKGANGNEEDHYATLKPPPLPPSPPPTLIMA